MIDKVKRYYYTCPLKAAYMAKYFGIKLCDRTLKESLVHLGDEFRYESVSIDGLWKSKYFDADKIIYIHPDSLILLESKVGDIITYPFQSFFQLEKGNSKIIDGGKIIQRNGIPFMWPEVE